MVHFRLVCVLLYTIMVSATTVWYRTSDKVRSYMAERFDEYRCLMVDRGKEVHVRCLQEDETMVEYRLPWYLFDPYFLFRKQSIAI